MSLGSDSFASVRMMFGDVQNVLTRSTYVKELSVVPVSIAAVVAAVAVPFLATGDVSVARFL